MKSHFGSIIVGLALAALYWFLFFYYGAYFDAEDDHLFIAFGILITVLGAWIAAMESPYLSNIQFWILVGICVALILWMAGTGAQHKVDPIEWLNKK
jgi:hypothetical protein